MLNPVQKAVRQKYLSQRQLHGVDVVYSDGDSDIQMTVIPARTTTRVEDSEARIQLRSYVRDYLILPEDMVVDDVQIYPKAGHLIIEGDATYEVPKELADEPAWRWDDEQTKQVFRVHTQLIAGT